MKTSSILWGLGTLLCAAFVAINVTVSQSFQDGIATLTVSELSAQASSFARFECSTGICVSLSGSDCDVPSDDCTITF